jgi:hypothetical protein
MVKNVSFTFIKREKNGEKETENIFIVAILYISVRIWLSIKKDEKVEKDRAVINKKIHIEL